ncbi:hypothetical protein B0T25DRAFT_611693 [Lasiosphaeria hispida]|uniref:Methyltransferase n=1 Tax=Lasiosphaeria hispida TaxID=260671 RepID=A0AAJ0HAL6_9PEZI|nr:hypothetical protein B0T25DRAFT_611693 [Lasiosphaeria hispida]
MNPIETTLEYIIDDHRFRTERPFAVHLGLGEKYAPDDPKLNTIQWKEEPTTVYDLRTLEDVTIEKYGFQTLSHKFTPSSTDEATYDTVERYQVETEEFLTGALGAEKVICYDHRLILQLRRNGPRHHPGSMVDVNDPLLIDLPPRGAHNITFDSGPAIIKKVLQETNQLGYLNKKYRFRIVNTWRPLIGKLDDRPLAVCDYRSLKVNDLIQADRVYVNLRSQLYYLKYDPAQRWYWFSHQSPEEVMLMLMYDTKPRPGNANFCPHVSFHNPKADKNAPPRESVETRNVVITLE